MLRLNNIKCSVSRSGRRAATGTGTSHSAPHLFTNYSGTLGKAKGGNHMLFTKLSESEQEFSMNNLILKPAYHIIPLGDLKTFETVSVSCWRSRCICLDQLIRTQ